MLGIRYSWEYRGMKVAPPLVREEHRGHEERTAGAARGHGDTCCGLAEQFVQSAAAVGGMMT
jgi:hypothetical protein